MRPASSLTRWRKHSGGHPTHSTARRSVQGQRTHLASRNAVHYAARQYDALPGILCCGCQVIDSLRRSQQQPAAQTRRLSCADGQYSSPNWSPLLAAAAVIKSTLSKWRSTAVAECAAEQRHLLSTCIYCDQSSLFSDGFERCSRTSLILDQCAAHLLRNSNQVHLASAASFMGVRGQHRLANAAGQVRRAAAAGREHCCGAGATIASASQVCLTYLDIA